MILTEFKLGLKVDWVYANSHVATFWSIGEHSIHMDLSITGFDHFPLSTYMHIGIDDQYESHSFFKINISLFELIDRRIVVARIWNLVPPLVGDSGWTLWWEATILCSTKFLRKWGKKMVRSRRGKDDQLPNSLLLARQRVEIDRFNTQIQRDVYEFEAQLRVFED